MKTEDFERLKAICKKEGFKAEFYQSKGTLMALVDKKDIWEGVEFVERINDGFDEPKGTVFKVLGITPGHIEVYDGWISKENLKPSTEHEYIEQLKKEAFERFGEIKEGEKFRTGYGIHSILPNHPEWLYNKHIDFLYYKGLIVYSKGDWAERIKERVKVECSGYGTYTKGDEITIDFKTNANFTNHSLHDVGKFLAKQLESYLNGEIE